VARRMRFRGGRRRRRPLDWVTTIGCYSWDVPPILLPDGTGTVQALTYYRDLTATAGQIADGPAALNARYFEFETTSLRVVGSVFAWILPDTSWWNTLTGRTALHFRIVKLKQFVFGIGGSGATTVAPNVADLQLATAGQDDFLYERTEHFLAQSAWGSLEIDPTMYVHRFDIDVGVKRRLEKGEVLAVHMQYGPGRDYAGDDEVFPDLAVDMRLRTLLAVKT